MKQILIYAGLFLVSCLLGLGLGYLAFHCKISTDTTNADYFKEPNFKPDTVHISNEGYDTIGYSNIKALTNTKLLPPKTVIEYHNYKPILGDTIFKGLISNNNGPLITNTINTQTTSTWSFDSIGMKYLGYTHLIYLRASEDTLLLTTQLYNNQPETKAYLVDFSKYKYEFLNNYMNTQQLKTTPPETIAKINNPLFQYNGTYIYLQNEFIGNNISNGLETSFNIWKLRLTGQAGYSIYNYQTRNSIINTTPSKPVVILKLGYKLF